MAKKAKVPAGCIFCGGRPLSDEHFWPEWAAEYLPQIDAHHRALTKGFVNADNEILRRDWKRQGFVGAITLPVVCNPCNNVWMNDLEIEVRPILEPMLKGEYKLLSAIDQSKLAKYIAMKVIVADHSIVEHAIFNDDERKGMYRNREIPPDLSIDIYRFRDAHIFLDYYNKEYHMFSPQEDGKPLNAFSMVNFTYSFGCILIRAMALRGSGPSPASQSPQQIRLHPPTNQQRAWPPIVDIDEPSALALQHALQLAHAEIGEAPSIVRYRRPNEVPYSERR